MTGTVTSSSGPVDASSLEFYATCEDYTADDPAAWGYGGGGTYTLTIPNGTYRVLISPQSGAKAVQSWHSGKPTCEQATVVTVNGSGPLNLVADAGSAVSGSVTSSNGPVHAGSAEFFATCEDYQLGNRAAWASISSGTYSARLPDGTYRVLIRSSSDTTAAHSWHSAKPNCAQADLVTVNGSTSNLDLVGSAGFDVTGLVTKGGNTVGDGNVSFYATCQDFINGEGIVSVSLQDGYYTTTLAPGTYKARIGLYGRNGTKYSWHSATGSCGSATSVTVSGSTTANLQARTTSTITGTVSGPGGPLGNGTLAFYATCQDYLDGNVTTDADFEDGTYAAGLPNGTYLAQIRPNSGAAQSWHNAATGCAGATAITVSGVGTHNLVAARGAVVTGSVSSIAGPIKGGGVHFYASCQAFLKDDAAANASIRKGSYQLNIVPGTYRVLISPHSGFGARESWHSAKSACDTATLVTISGDGTVNLVALPKYAPPIDPGPGPIQPPNPPGPPTALSGQTVKKPPAKLKKGKKVKLAKKTRQGATISWKSKTKKVCLVKKNVLRAKKKGLCKISASAPGPFGFQPFAKKYTIRVR